MKAPQWNSNENPHFKQNCVDCVFLGSVTIAGKVGDVWVHPQGSMRMDDVLVRFSDEPSDYLSTWPIVFSPLDPWLAVAIAMWSQSRGFNCWSQAQGTLSKDGTDACHLWGP